MIVTVLIVFFMLFTWYLDESLVVFRSWKTMLSRGIESKMMKTTLTLKPGGNCSNVKSSFWC